MARVTMFVYCENVQNENTPLGPKNNIIGPMNAIRPMFIPGTFSFSIFTSIVDVDLKKTHNFRIVLSDGFKDIVDTGNALIPPQNIEPDLPESERGFMLNMDLRNVIFEKEGSYIGKVYFDDDILGEYPIYVKAANNAKVN